MIWAQIKGSHKLHLAAEAGEEYRGKVIPWGFISAPLCGTPHFHGSYRMTINVSLGEPCRNCLRVADAKRRDD